MANEVAAKQSGSLALFGDDAKGFDNMTQDDLALPFVNLGSVVTTSDSRGLEVYRGCQTWYDL